MKSLFRLVYTNSNYFYYVLFFKLSKKNAKYFSNYYYVSYGKSFIASLNNSAAYYFYINKSFNSLLSFELLSKSNKIEFEILS